MTPETVASDGRPGQQIAERVVDHCTTKRMRFKNPGKSKKQIENAKTYR
jgi:hypothetical protein